MKNKVIKSKTKTALFTVFFLSVCLCSILYLTKGENFFLSLANEKAIPNQDALNTDYSTVPEQQEGLKKDTYIREEKVIETWEEFKASNLPLISAIPERNIYLYAIKPTGVVLYVNGGGHYFEWAYLTPRFILPKMNVGDFDNDNEEELSVSLYIGSGTGCAVEDLHIVEMSGDEVMSRNPDHKDYLVPNPEYFADYCYYPKEYLSQLNEIVELKTYDKEGELKADITVGDELYTVSLKQLQADDADIIINDAAYFGDIVHFNVKDGKLAAEFTMWVTASSSAAPRFIGDVYADVNYNEGKFMLSNLRFEAHKGF